MWVNESRCTNGRTTRYASVSSPHDLESESESAFPYKTNRARERESTFGGEAVTVTSSQDTDRESVCVCVLQVRGGLQGERRGGMAGIGGRLSAWGVVMGCSHGVS